MQVELDDPYEIAIIANALRSYHDELRYNRGIDFSMYQTKLTAILFILDKIGKPKGLE